MKTPENQRHIAFVCFFYPKQSRQIASLPIKRYE